MLFLWPFLVLGSPVERPEKRQLKEIAAASGIGLKEILSGLGRFLPIEKVTKTESLGPRIRTTAKRNKIMWGPYEFKPAKNVCRFMTPDGQYVLTWNKDTTPSLLTTFSMQIGLQMDVNAQLAIKKLDGFCKDCVCVSSN